jgi:hypothetical protein
VTQRSGKSRTAERSEMAHATKIQKVHDFP